jgi:hypothetical protein
VAEPKATVMSQSDKFDKLKKSSKKRVIECGWHPYSKREYDVEKKKHRLLKNNWNPSILLDQKNTNNHQATWFLTNNHL